MVDIFDEVNEDLRAERAKRLMQRYGGLMVGACVAVIAGVGAWQGWQYWQAKQDAAAAAAYLASLSTIESSPVLADAQRKVALAGFEALTQAKQDGALALWDQVAADSGADPLLRDLASLLWASRQVDAGDPALLEARLRPLTMPGNNWRSLAQEQLALLLLRQDKTEDAKTALRKLADDVTAPGGVRGRSRALLDRLGG